MSFCFTKRVSRQNYKLSTSDLCFRDTWTVALYSSTSSHYCVMPSGLCSWGSITLSTPPLFTLSWKFEPFLLCHSVTLVGLSHAITLWFAIGNTVKGFLSSTNDHRRHQGNSVISRTVSSSELAVTPRYSYLSTINAMVTIRGVAPH